VFVSCIHFRINTIPIKVSRSFKLSGSCPERRGEVPTFPNFVDDESDSDRDESFDNTCWVMMPR
jgi:hypothetical protein